MGSPSSLTRVLYRATLTLYLAYAAVMVGEWMSASRITVPGVDITPYTRHGEIGWMVVDDWGACGIERGTWITAINGRPLGNSRETLRQLQTLDPGDPVRLNVDSSDRASFSCEAVQPPHAARQLLWLVTAVSFAFVAVFILRAGEAHIGVLGFSLLATGMALGASTGAVAPTYLGISSFFGGYYDERVLTVAFAMVSLGFIPFTLYCPFPLPGVARLKWLPELFVWGAPLVLLAGPALGLALGEGAALAFNETMVFLDVAVAVLGVALHAWRARYARTPQLQLRQRSGVLVQSALLFGFLAVVFVAYQGGAFGLSFMAELGAGLICCVPFAILAPLVLLDLDRAVLQTWSTRSMRFLATVVSAAVTLELSSVLELLPQGSASSLALACFMGFAADRAMIPPLRRWSLRDLRSAENRLSAVNKQIRAVAHRSFANVASEVGRELHGLVDSEWLAVWVFDSDGENSTLVWQSNDTPQSVKSWRPEPTPTLTKSSADHELLVIWSEANLPIGALAIPAGVDEDDLALLRYFVVGAASAQQFSERETRIGDYRLTRFLASGGMGSVYVATPTTLTGVGEVVIKTIRSELLDDERSRTLFLREAELVKTLRHPNIVETFDCGVDERGTAFIAMELIDGCDARQLIRAGTTRGPIPVELACAIFSEVCEALCYLHASDHHAKRGEALYHQDISPDNVFLSRDGWVKLADFGVSLTAGEATHRIGGKSAYLAPELSSGAPASPRTDLFAAGILFFELLTREHPYAQGNPELTREAIANGRHLPLESLRTDVDASLRALVEALLSPDPERRPGSAGEVIAVLSNRVQRQTDDRMALAALASRARLTGSSVPLFEGQTE